MRSQFVRVAAATVIGLLLLSLFIPAVTWLFLIVLPLVGLGVYDMVQTKHTIRRNFPILGHGRYLLEMIRPEINQYFVESNTDGMPFSREDRSLVYQRAKGVLDTVPFGTQSNLYEPGAEWMHHSMAPIHLEDEPRVLIGEGRADHPYSLSVLNISAMSYGSLGSTAIAALNRGAKKGAFAHNTGEGGISHYHLHGGDLIWQIGTGYFGCRTERGTFDPERFAENARQSSVKMIEVKLSQGAKPGHGGILPASKVTPEIARIRGVSLGRDVLSPPGHSAFSTPRGLLEFIDELRKLSGGKPVGFKLCVGKWREFLGVVKAMRETGSCPDFITVDGAEGGTGAAPLEFSNSLGQPMTEGLVFVHNALVGADLREKIKVIASGKIITGFDIARALALGADACYSARGMMMALGCIQARRCNSNDCPAGVATMAPELTVGLVVEEKAPRVASYHKETVESFLELMGAAGIDHPRKLRPWHIIRRVTFAETRHYGQLFEFLDSGALLRGQLSEAYARAWTLADPDTFESATELTSRGLPVVQAS